MSTRDALVAVAVALMFGTGLALAETPGLGNPITESDIAAWDIAVMPSGAGLPPGSGTAAQGATVFAQKCALCHGEGGKGGPVARNPLFGGRPLTDGIDTPKTIGNFWGHATTVFDFTRRAMPFNQPRQQITADEIYATTAYMLFLNKIIGENDVMDAQTLPKVKMPNRDNFIIRFPDRI
jgi:S-disulfanyl-L-cysteine oxidoreductase SoxD